MQSTNNARRDTGNLPTERLENLLTVEQLADRLHVSKHAVYQWCHKQTVPFYRLGKRSLFDPVEIAAWLQLKRVDPRGDV